MKLCLRSPAKINRYLKVLGKRSDGYHLLETLMQTISLSDFLSIELSDKDHLQISEKSLLLDSSNLVFRAKQAFSQYIGKDLYINAHLTKNIPIGAGLGGGSSNAATTLFALNKLTNANLTDKQLRAIAEPLGADIPFFLSNGYALCTGIGNIIKPISIQNFHEKPITLCIAKDSISTPAVFNNFSISKLKDDSLFQFKGDSFQNENDLIAAAMITSTSFAKEFKRLQQSLTTPLYMSGSGSCCFIESSGIDIKNDPYWTFISANPIFRNSDLWYDLHN